LSRDYQAGVSYSTPPQQHATETANIEIRVEPQLVEIRCGECIDRTAASLE
jgi:hypothetical protein